MTSIGKIVLTLILILEQIASEVHNIKEFRNNPLGISLQEGIYEVDLGIPKDYRIVSYVDFTKDKK